MLGCYSASPETFMVGACTAGGMLCSSGAYGSCLGEVLPTTEVCGNQIDEDCNGVKDDKTVEGAEGCLWFYLDQDGDHYGDPNDPGICRCGNPDLQRYPIDNIDKNDCNDGNAAVHPNADWHTVPYGFPASWDYTCDGQVTKRYEELKNINDPNPPCFNGWTCAGSGWYETAVPECGVTAEWWDCTTATPDGSYNCSGGTLTTMEQECK